MKYAALATLLISLAIPVTAYANDMVARANQILATKPEQAVKTAVGNNDFRSLHAPAYAEGMPGFYFAGYRDERPINVKCSITSRSYQTLASLAQLRR